MNMNRKLLLSLAIVCLLVFSLQVAFAAENPNKPNIVIREFDTCNMKKCL